MAAAKTKKRKLIINRKEFTMPQKIDVDAYLHYLEVRDEVMDTEHSHGLYTRKQFGEMMDCIVEIYGNQFTVDELKDAETGLSVGGIITEFVMIEAAIGEEVNKKVEKIQENFSAGE